MRQSRFRRLLGALVAAAVAAAYGGLPNLTAQAHRAARRPPPDPAAEVARLTRNVAGDSTPIVVGADDVATWVENGQRIVMARGKVLVQEGVVQVRASQAVAFVDLRGGILHMDVYAEGDVQIDNSSAVKAAPRAFVSLTTRGEFRLRAYKNKVLQQSLADDPLIQRAEPSAQLRRRPPSRPRPPNPPPARTGRRRRQGRRLSRPAPCARWTTRNRRGRRPGRRRPPRRDRLRRSLRDRRRCRPRRNRA